MDTKTAIARVFRAFAGVNPDLLGASWDRATAEELSSISANEAESLADLRERLALCASGKGVEATGVMTWEYGLIVLMRGLARSHSPAVQMFLREVAVLPCDSMLTPLFRGEAQRLLNESFPSYAAGVQSAPQTIPAQAPAMQPPPQRPPHQPPAPNPPPYPSAAPGAPVYPPYRPAAPVTAPMYPPAGTAYRPNAAPVTLPPLSPMGLILPVILLFAVWLLCLLIPSKGTVYPNSLLGLYATAYCLLLGFAFTLFSRKRYLFGIIVVIPGAFLSTLALALAKLSSIQSGLRFFSMFGFAQFWLDFSILLIPAALITLCALLLPRILRANKSHAIELCSGLAMFVFSTVAMLLMIPGLDLIPVLFAVFTSIILGAFVAGSALITAQASTQTRVKAKLETGLSVWFGVFLGVTFVALAILGIAWEAHVTVFMIGMMIIQIVMLIRLLCAHRAAFVWYVIAATTTFMCGLTYFLFSFIISTGWLPLILISGLSCAIGPLGGWFLMRKQQRSGFSPAQQAAPAYAPPSPAQRPPYAPPSQQAAPAYAPPAQRPPVYAPQQQPSPQAPPPQRPAYTPPPTPKAAICSKCGAALEPNTRFCAACGQPVPPQAPPAPPQRPADDATIGFFGDEPLRTAPPSPPTEKSAEPAPSMDADEASPPVHTDDPNSAYKKGGDPS